MSKYADLIPSNHSTKPKFVATVEATCSPLLDCQVLLESMRTCFDLETAIGAQLDRIGERIGLNRLVQTEITGVFFSMNMTEEVGWQRGIWRDKYDDPTTTVSLNDSDYRILLKAKIASNMWDGTIENIYDTWAQVFPPTSSFVVVTDNQNMSMNLGLIGVQISELMQQLITAGYLPFKPSGVSINYYIAPEVDHTKIFAWNQQNLAMDGWNIGYWPSIG